MKTKSNICYNILLVVLIVVAFYVSVSNNIVNNQNVRNIANRLTEGSVNTLLLLAIIGLTLTEDLNVGFLTCEKDFMADLKLFLITR